MRIARIVLMGVLAAAAGMAEDKRTDVGVARVAAEENAKTPAGKRYEVGLEASLGPWLKKALERCIHDAAKTELSDFDVFVRISNAGEAEEVLFGGAETAVTRCVQPDFRDARYPHPPQPSWWVKVGVQLR